MVDYNKCQICGLRLEVRDFPSPNTIPSERDFDLLHKLQENKIIKQKFSRNIFVGGNLECHEFCVIDSDKWNKNSESCPWWQLKIGELGLPGHVSIYHAKRNAKSACFLAVVAIGISTLILSVIIFINFFK